MGVLHVGVLLGWWLRLLNVGGGVACRGVVGVVVVECWWGCCV